MTASASVFSSFCYCKPSDINNRFARVIAWREPATCTQFDAFVDECGNQ